MKFHRVIKFEFLAFNLLFIVQIITSASKHGLGALCSLLYSSRQGIWGQAEGSVSCIKQGCYFCKADRNYAGFTSELITTVELLLYK